MQFHNASNCFIGHRYELQVNVWLLPVSMHPVCFAPGSVVKKPGVIKDEIQIREFLEMTILIDHNVIDGAPAARFIARLSEIIRDCFAL